MAVELQEPKGNQAMALLAPFTASCGIASLVREEAHMPSLAPALAGS